MKTLISECDKRVKQWKNLTILKKKEDLCSLKVLFGDYTQLLTFIF